MSTKKQREDMAVEAIMCVCLKAEKERWSKERWDRFWRKVYRNVKLHTGE